jgi:hypothetical protein
LPFSLLATAILYRFPPDTYAFYPRCPIHELTGLLCPGCGATRALAALLHGRLSEALHQNGLFVLLLPFAALYLTAAWRGTRKGESWPSLPRPMLGVLLLATLAFAVWRNLA